MPENDGNTAHSAGETQSAPGDLSQPSKGWRHRSHHCYTVGHHFRPHPPKRLQRRAEEPCVSCGHRATATRRNVDDGTAISDHQQDDHENRPLMHHRQKNGSNGWRSARCSQPDTTKPTCAGGQQRQQKQYDKSQRRGHLRGTRSNGFASGPPFPNRTLDKKRRRQHSCDYEDDEAEDICDDHYPLDRATVLNERQKQQQFALIEQEINVLANETKCGIGSWRPKWLQKFARKEWMLILLCWFCTIQGMIVNGLFPSSISTIERRFQFSTSTLGRIMQFYDFGYVLFCIPVSYFGGRHSKSTGLGAGLLLMSLGSLVFTLPHFLAEPYTTSYQIENTGLSRCLNDFSNRSTIFGAFTNDTTGKQVVDQQQIQDGAEFDALQACTSPENQPGTFRYVFLFCLAHFMHGVGATPLYTIGVSYIDENVGPLLSSLYIGVFYAFAIFGPAIGFFASSKFLLWHTDFLVTGQKLQKLIIDLDETDPKWVGAWYLGFLLASILGLMAVFPTLIFPKLLPESLKWHRTRLQEETLGQKKRSPECCGIPPSSGNRTAIVFGAGSANFDEDGNEKAPMVQFQSSALKPRSGPIWYQLWLDVRHIPIAIYKILLNGPYMLITLGMSIDGLIVTGCSTFMSKYLERQFGVAPSKATLFMGAVMVPMAGFGTMFSGLIIHHFRLSCVRTLQYCIALVLCSLLLSPMYFIYCDHDQLVGIERHYPVDDAPGNHYNAKTDTFVYHLDARCNAQCHCSPTEYHPVCAEHIDGSQMAYYSPCYAGCPSPYAAQTKEYLNCSCVPDEMKGGTRRVKRGFCESKCRGLFAFMVFFAPFCFFTFAVGIALITVVLRTVDYDERSFALGIQWILVRVIGTIPAPVVFGWLFDFSCIRQHLDPCSGEPHGSCMLYHNKSLADLFLAFTVAGQLIALVCLIGVLMFFAHSLRDEPLPTGAVKTPTVPDENTVDAYYKSHAVAESSDMDNNNFA
ncbi:hypothetical protein niasHS_009117 [Heterodera schachtii]|uniref:Solute carrier organic anion transporter family member n=1 Tax=Heterodera schachtii TaxID=97005 RepID=A0ABD2JE30_HETSC